MIDEMEKGLPLGTQSCKRALVELLQKQYPVNQISDMTQIYELLASSALSHLSSGEYHIDYGQINPLGIGNALKAVFYGCLDRLLKDGKISQAEYDTRHGTLKINISEVG